MDDTFGEAPPQAGGTGNRFFPHLKSFMTSYAAGTTDDGRSVGVFMECEAQESVASLRAELRAISAGNFSIETLHTIVGKGRCAKHGTYDQWAAAMLRWMASHRR